MVILISPLDWGLGHATRCIPIINELIYNGHSVICAADGDTRKILQKEFPFVEHVPFKGYNIKYSKGNSQTIKLLLQLPKAMNSIWREHRQIGKLIDKHNIDIVISDNRYGLYSTKAKTIFITHQIYIKTPFKWLSSVANIINHWFISKFDKCWIPDVDDFINISGELSYNEAGNTFINRQLRLKKLSYIAPLSHLSHKENKSEQCDSILAIISGTEPQRSILEKKLINKLIKYGKKADIILGKTGNNNVIQSEQLTIYSYLDGEQLSNKIQSAKTIICRSGYSTLMDMVILKKNPILIPTPGQTEQEYLARYAQECGWAYCMLQDNINIEEAIKKSQSLKTLDINIGNYLKLEIEQLNSL